MCGFDNDFDASELFPVPCDTPCSGDASVTCGGDRAYDLYELGGNVPLVRDAPEAADDDAAYEAEYEEEQEEELYVERLHEHYAQMEEDQMDEMDEEEMYEEALDDMPVIGGASVASGDDAEYEAEYEEEMNEEEMYEEALDDMPVIGGASVASGDEAEYELYEEETKDVEMYLEEMDEEEYQEYQEEMEIGDASEASVVSVASVGDEEYEAEYEEDMYEEEMDEEEEYAEEVHEHYAHMDEDKMDDMPVMGGASVASGDDAAYEAYEEEMYEEALDDMPVIGGASVASGDDEAEYEEEMYEEELHEHYAHMDEEEMYEEEMYEVPAIGGASVASGNDEAGYEEEMYEEMYEEELVEHKSMSGNASAVVFEGCYWTIVGEIDESNTMSSAHMTPSVSDGIFRRTSLPTLSMVVVSYDRMAKTVGKASPTQVNLSYPVVCLTSLFLPCPLLPVKCMYPTLLLLRSLSRCAWSIASNSTRSHSYCTRASSACAITTTASRPWKRRPIPATSRAEATSHSRAAEETHSACMKRWADLIPQTQQE